MIKNWCRKNHKALSIAFISVLAVAILVLFVFALFNASAIKGFVKGIFSTLLPFFYGFTFAYLCNPIYKKLYKYAFKFCDHKKPRPRLRKSLSIFSAFIIFIGIIALILWGIIPQIIKVLDGDSISSYIVAFEEFAYKLIDQISLTINIDADQIQDFLTTKISEISDKILSADLTTILITFAKEIIIQIFDIVVGFILSIYFLIYKESIIAKAKRFLCAIFKKNSYEKIIDFARYTDKTFGRYLIGVLVDSVLVGFVVFLILAIIKFPFAPLIGVIVGVTNIIPFFGPFIGAIPSAILVLLGSLNQGYDGKEAIIRVIIFALIILVVQQIDGNIIAPHIQGTATGITPIGVILAVTLCSDLFGFIGMVIGVPLFAVLAYLINKLLEKRLKKKKLPVNTAFYRAKNIYQDEGFIKAQNALVAQARANRHEAVEKAKAQNKITEEEIQEVEERIVEEIISTAADETVAKAEADEKNETGLITPVKDENPKK